MRRHIITILAVIYYGATPFVAAQYAGGSERHACGEFDTALLRQDLESGYFERGGLELAKDTMRLLAEQLDCERREDESH